MAGEKRTMTLNLSDIEMDLLDRLSAGKDMSKTAVIRHALRLYQLVDARLAKGEKLFVEDGPDKKAELIVL